MPASHLPDGRAELEARGMALVHHLGGRWTGGGGLCLCPAHADRSPSLSVRTGHTHLLFKCFAGCDTIDVLRAIARLAPIPISAVPRTMAVQSHADEAWLRSRVTDLWTQAKAVPGTLVEHYLLNRAITGAPPALRFHPRTPLGPRRARIFRPAMLAAVREGANLVAVQRTFLDPKTARRARDLANPRRMLGRPAGGAVMLASATHVLGLAEGIETALSAMILLDIPVWAVLGNERFARVAVPSAVERLILLPDNDRAGRQAESLALVSYSGPNRAVETVWPWWGLNDWNDVLRKNNPRSTQPPKAATMGSSR